MLVLTLAILLNLAFPQGIPEDSVAQASSSLMSCIPKAVDFGTSMGRFGSISGGPSLNLGYLEMRMRADTDLLVVDDDTPSSLSVGMGGVFREQQNSSAPPPSGMDQGGGRGSTRETIEL